MNRFLLIVSSSVALTFNAFADNNPVIDRMYTSTFGGYTQNYDPSTGQFLIFPTANYYQLSNGTSWQSGAGTGSSTYVTETSVQVVGNNIFYTFSTPSNGILFQNVDYDSGDHSAQGTLGVTSSLVIEATLGSTTGEMIGGTSILANNATYYGEPRFNYYAAPVGSDVYFQQNYTLSNGATFTANLFNNPFVYNETGEVDFTQSVPEPGTYALALAGMMGLATLRRARILPRPTNT